MIALDTSVLARWIVGDTPAEQASAIQMISDRDCSVSWSVLIELCWVLERSVRLPRDEVIGAMAMIVETETILSPDDDLLAWAIDRYAQGADFADMVHLASALRGSESFASFDRKLARQAGEDTPLPVMTLRA